MVKVSRRGVLNVEVSRTDAIDDLVYHEGTIRGLQGGVGGEDEIVRFSHSSGNLGGWGDRELQLGLLSIINREPLHPQVNPEPVPSPKLENEEAPKTSALVSQ